MESLISHALNIAELFGMIILCIIGGYICERLHVLTQVLLKINAELRLKNSRNW